MDLQNKDSGDVLSVVIIGNGPSGICLSYLLSGHTPYFSPEAFHPNPILHRKLKENVHLPLFEQDLEYLCEGLEGRSSNPLAVLFDSLLLPDSDFGLDCASPLQWRYEPERAINHLVLGKGPPGGAWHAMEGSMLTLSLANWMELPGLNLKDWMREKRRNVRNDRATSADIASYYQHYVKTMGLSNNFAHGTTVTSVQRAPFGSGQSVWHIKGIQRLDNGDAVPFFVQAENIVLATGTSDSPAHLGVEGESLPFVFHSFREFETVISSGRLCKSSDPVLVVGAGLTAADAVLCTHHLNVPVYHTFRRGVMDPALIFNQLPRLLYPEYHKVHQMMSQQQYQPSHSLPNLLSQHVASTDNDHTNSSSYPGYMSFPKHRVVSFNPNGKCVLEAEDGHHVVLQVSLALVLIGSQPNLSFLPEDGRQLGLEPGQPISCRRNPIKVETYTCESVREVGLYALGPLVGENFVRFLKGGALGTACHLMQKSKEKSMTVL
ncbi:oxidative stress induced growth inhibitor 1 [Clarias gariepinus]|uniref:oxidative stress induced growth inhibitor 1 n=1 Tax=Clarias gariepinus TaxID=13013 RepID=UPI00234DAE41|nr:oxidative stress induced growth inhibitor 1 [Clarias gariepinus]XP_053354079.1 oxidative stress induced growth inhibitor 1 [Clarias gariepinus]XP_053354080.1 oxidative stress induced growth inhibitor 1 [Clarias gariepinus]XP_053354081.1 oxidative stress induced growth inhibitor 1 [Clarias gariepinus]